MGKDDNSGLISYKGFVYQKYVFVYCVMEYIHSYQSIGYEVLDDVSLQESLDLNNALFKNASDGSVAIQCKTGIITDQVLQNVFFNWILDGVAHKNVLFVEQNYTLPDENALLLALKKRVQDFKPKAKGRKSVIERLQDVYLKGGSIDSSFDAAFSSVFNAASVRSLSFDELDSEMVETFKRRHNVDTCRSGYAILEKVNYIKKMLFNDIDTFVRNSTSLLRGPTIDINHFNSYCNQANSLISDTEYNVPFIKYKNGLSIGETEIQSKFFRERRLISKVYSLSKESDQRTLLMNYLHQEVYYKAYRGFLTNTNQRDVAEGAENAAYIQYLSLREGGKGADLRGLFQSLVVEASSFFDFNTKDLPAIQKGCYMYLTNDAQLSSPYFIDWGGATDND